MSIAKFLGTSSGNIARQKQWILAIGAADPLPEARKMLPGHSKNEWQQNWIMNSVLALAHIDELVPPSEAAERCPHRADTGAYVFDKGKSAAKPRLRSRNRFGSGDDMQSCATTRLQPPVCFCRNFAVFTLECAGPQDDSVSELLKGKVFRDLPLAVAPGHMCWDSVIALMRRAWAAADY